MTNGLENCKNKSAWQWQQRQQPLGTVGLLGKETITVCLQQLKYDIILWPSTVL